MKSGAVVTYWVVVVGASLAAGYDLFALTFFGAQATLSDVLRGLGMNYPVLDFLAGLIVGHLIWPVMADRRKA